MQLPSRVTPPPPRKKQRSSSAKEREATSGKGGRYHSPLLLAAQHKTRTAVGKDPTPPPDQPEEARGCRTRLESKLRCRRGRCLDFCRYLRCYNNPIPLCNTEKAQVARPVLPVLHARNTRENRRTYEMYSARHAATSKTTPSHPQNAVQPPLTKNRAFQTNKAKWLRELSQRA